MKFGYLLFIVNKKIFGSEKKQLRRQDAKKLSCIFYPGGEADPTHHVNYFVFQLLD
jgi:hypothetical protein